MENVKDDMICLTSNVNMPSFDSITINGEIVTPNTKSLSESFISIKSYISPVDGVQC